MQKVSLVAVLFGELLAQGSEQLLVSVDHPTAQTADQVNVCAMVRRGVHHTSVSQIQAADQALCREESQRAVNSGKIGGSRMLLDTFQDLLCRDVMLTVGDGIDDPFALWRNAIAFLAQAFDERVVVCHRQGDRDQESGWCEQILLRIFAIRLYHYLSYLYKSKGTGLSSTRT